MRGTVLLALTVCSSPYPYPYTYLGIVAAVRGVFEKFVGFGHYEKNLCGDFKYFFYTKIISCFHFIFHELFEVLLYICLNLGPECMVCFSQGRVSGSISRLVQILLCKRYICFYFPCYVSDTSRNPWFQK